MAGARISCFAMSIFKTSNTEPVDRLHISCHGSVTLQGSFRIIVIVVRMPRLIFFVASTIFLKYPLKNR